MRSNLYFLSLSLLTVATCFSPALAAEVLIEAAPGAEYSEEGTSWADVTTSRGDTKARVMKASPDGTLVGSAIFSALIPEDGKYAVSIAWPAKVANAKGIQVSVKEGNATLLSRRITVSSEAGTDASVDGFREVGLLELKKGQQLSVAVEPTPQTAAARTDAPLALALDALRIASPGAPVSAAMPFEGAPPSAPIADVEDPFAVAPAAGVVTTPKAAPAPVEADDPFATTTTVGGPARPAPSKPASEVEDPFAVAPPAKPAATEVEDPFAVGGPTKPAVVSPAPEVEDPFAVAAPAKAAAPAVTEVEDPFAMIDPPKAAAPIAADVEDPFAVAAPGAAKPPVADVDDPFAVASAAKPSVPAVPEADDPFAVAPTPPSVPKATATDDPFLPATGRIELPPKPAVDADDPFASPPVVSTDPPKATVPVAAPPPILPADDPFAIDGGTPVNDPVAADPFASPEAALARGASDSPLPAGSAGDVFATNTTPVAPAPTPSSSAIVRDGGRAAAPGLVAENPFGETASAAVATPSPTPAAVVRTPAPAAPPEEVPFEASRTIEEAVKKAAVSSKPIVVLFSGDSLASRNFEKLLRTPEVARQLAAFEIVQLDYRENRPVAKKYAVPSFPYIVVLNKSGFTLGHVRAHRTSASLVQQLSPFTQRLRIE